MTTDTFVPWKDYVNALGLGVMSMLTVGLVFVYTPLPTILPQSIIENGPLIVGSAFFVAYVMAYSDRNF